MGGDTTVPVDDLLMSLVDKSLLTANRGPIGMRFRQLETVRQYGEARLQGRGLVAASMRRQLDHYVAWTESADAGIKSPDELHWHHWFTAEWPNVRNVFRWACTVDDGDAACRLVSATLWWATSRMQLEADRWCELALGMPSAADHPLRPVVLAGASLFAHRRGDHDRDRRSLERARDEEQRLGVAASPLVEVAALNEWNGGPAGAMRDVAALRLRAEHVSDEFWQLAAALGEAQILAAMTRGAAPSPDEEADYIARISQIVGQAESYGQPSSVADTRASLGIALRSSQPAAALTLLEDALDLCAPLGVEETSNTARCELASHYTQLERPRDALALIRTTIPAYVRVGAWHDVYAALARHRSSVRRCRSPSRRRDHPRPARHRDQRVQPELLRVSGTSRPTRRGTRRRRLRHAGQREPIPNARRHRTTRGRTRSTSSDAERARSRGPARPIDDSSLIGTDGARLRVRL